MTPAERLRLLAGDQDLYKDMLGAAGPAGDAADYQPPLYSAAAVPRLGLGGLYFVDGPRGVARGVSTCFPVAIARAASFDYDLEERVGEAIGREARAQGANVCLAPCLNLLRHPGWGRAQETYGENSEHIGEMGAAFVRGLQRHVMGCAKHFACNSIEDSRFKVDVRVQPRGARSTSISPTSSEWSTREWPPSCRPTTRSTESGAGRTTGCSRRSSKNAGASTASW